LSDYPRIIIDLNKIQHNAKTITGLASKYGMSRVTKQWGC